MQTQKRPKKFLSKHHTEKVKPRAQTATPAVPEIKDKTLTDMRLFFRTVDWAVWWEEFYLEVTPEGFPKYRSLKSFIRGRAKSEQQAEFLWWYLGPDDEEAAKSAQKYAATAARQPQDWIKKRDTGGWFGVDSMKELGREITRRMSALEAMQEAGNKVALVSYLRTGRLAAELDKAFQGVLFVPGIPIDKNIDRARAYLDLTGKVLQLQKTAQEGYARSHGIDFDDMAGIVRLYEAAALSAQQKRLSGIDGQETKSQAAVRALTEMTLAKAARYKIPLPEEVEGVVVDAVADAEDRQERKKKLQ